MPITRSVWIDDDGTGTTGTVINNAELQKIYDNVDAASSSMDGVAISATGTLHNWAPPFGQRSAFYLWTGGAPTLITGIAAGREGQVLTFLHAGAAGVALAFAAAHSGSVVPNQLDLFASSAPTPIAVTGRAQFVYTLGRWRLVGHEQGVWINQPYSAADYGSSAGTWTVTAGNLIAARYRLAGRTLHWTLTIQGSTLSAAAKLNVRVFGGFQYAAGGKYPFLVHVTDPGVADVAFGFSEEAGLVEIYRTAAGGLINAGGITLYASGTLEVT